MAFGRAARLVALQALLILCFTFFADRCLGWLGFPSEVPQRAANPPNYRATKKNLDFQHEFSTNSQGLRYREIPLAKPAAEYRIVVLGDSFVEGVGVEQNETFTSHLEQRFSSERRPVQFINAGLAGTEPYQYGTTLFGVGVRYQPDAVLICLYANDLASIDPFAQPRDMHAGSVSRIGWRRYLHALWPRTFVLIKQFQARYNDWRRPDDFAQGVIHSARLAGVPESRISEWKTRVPQALLDAAGRGEINPTLLRFGLIRPDYWTTALDVDTEVALMMWRSMSGILDEMVSESRRRGMRVASIYIPSVFQYSPAMHAPEASRHPWRLSGTTIRAEWLHADTRAQQLLREWFSARKVPFFDLTGPLRRAAREGARLHWKIDDHFTALGHRVAAQSIGDWLRDDCVFPIGDRCAGESGAHP